MFRRWKLIGMIETYEEPDSDLYTVVIDYFDYFDRKAKTATFKEIRSIEIWDRTGATLMVIVPPLTAKTTLDGDFQVWNNDLIIKLRGKLIPNFSAVSKPEQFSETKK